MNCAASNAGSALAPSGGCSADAPATSTSRQKALAKRICSGRRQRIRSNAGEHTKMANPRAREIATLRRLRSETSLRRLAVKLAVKLDPRWSFGGRFEYVAS